MTTPATTFGADEIHFDGPCVSSRGLGAQTIVSTGHLQGRAGPSSGRPSPIGGREASKEADSR